MSLRPGPEIFESQLQRMIRVLKTGVEYHPANISAAGTRANRPVRAASEFAVVQQKAMGYIPLELSRSAEASLLAAISASRPLVLRSGLAAVDAAGLVDEWELVTFLGWPSTAAVVVGSITMIGCVCLTNIPLGTFVKFVCWLLFVLSLLIFWLWCLYLWATFFVIGSIEMAVAVFLGISFFLDASDHNIAWLMLSTQIKTIWSGAQIMSVFPSEPSMSLISYLPGSLQRYCSMLVQLVVNVNNVFTLAYVHRNFESGLAELVITTTTPIVLALGIWIAFVVRKHVLAHAGAKKTPKLASF